MSGPFLGDDPTRMAWLAHLLAERGPPQWSDPERTGLGVALLNAAGASPAWPSDAPQSIPAPERRVSTSVTQPLRAVRFAIPTDATEIDSRPPVLAEILARPCPEPQAELSTFELRLVDADGRPIPRVAYRLELPDGSERHGRLDGAGELFVEDVPEGRCKVTFPQLEEDRERLAREQETTAQ